MRALRTALLLGLALAGASAGGAGAMSRPPKSTCDTEAHAGLIGQTWTEALMPERKDPVRVLHPDSMMTMDYRQERLNIQVDADGKVSGLRCG